MIMQSYECDSINMAAGFITAMCFDLLTCLISCLVSILVTEFSLLYLSKKSYKCKFKHAVSKKVDNETIGMYLYSLTGTLLKALFVKHLLAVNAMPR